MAKFGINDILNAKTKAAGQQAQTEGYKEIYLSPYEVKAAQENTHQKLENIEELADSFLHVGQEQPTVLARVNGEYRIIDGHRRNAANILNLERGHKEYEKVLYRFMDMSEAMYELRLLAGNGYTQELTAYATTFNAPYLLYEFEDGTKIYERIDAHALDSADMSDVIMQYDHEGRVFARQSNNTLILEPDAKGLFVAADLSRTDLARGLYQDISAGMITKMSWAFTVAEESYDRETHTRTILKIKKVYDVSAVSIPANNDTEISARAFASRSYERERQELLKRRAAILKIKASL